MSLETEGNGLLTIRTTCFSGFQTDCLKELNREGWRFMFYNAKGGKVA